jgi:hypothetical protein
MLLSSPTLDLSALEEFEMKTQSIDLETNGMSCNARKIRNGNCISRNLNESNSSPRNSQESDKQSCED